MDGERKTWSRPALTVLVRLHAEENLVQTCKGSASGSGLNAQFGGCGNAMCSQCNSTSTS